MAQTAARPTNRSLQSRTGKPIKLTAQEDRLRNISSYVNDKRPGSYNSEKTHAVCDNLQEALDCPITGLPQTMYALQHSEFALTDALADQRFDDEINYFAMSVSSQVASDQSGNLIATSSPRSPFLAKSICLVVWVDPWQATIAGRSSTLSTSAPDNSVDVPVFTGAVPFVADGTNRPASFRLGWDVLEAAQSYLASYRINLWLGGQLKVVDELLRHVGTIESNNKACGYGNAQRSIADWIFDCNRRQAENGSDQVFLPITASASGQTFVGNLPPLVDQTVGSVLVEGAFGTCFPIRPMLLLPGMPVDVQMIREVGSDVDHDRLLRSAKFNGVQRYAPAYTDTLAGNLGYACDVQFKYGQMTIGLMYRGLQLTPRCCLDYYYNFGWWQSPVFEQDAARRKLETYANSLGMRLPLPRDPREGVPVLSGFENNEQDLAELEKLYDPKFTQGPGGKQFARLGTINPWENP